MDDKNILEKIKKCLALAESSNENESRDALLKAQKLMVKYHISEKHLLKHDKEKEEKTIENARKSTKIVNAIYGKARIMWYESYLGMIIDKNFRVICFLRGSKKGRSLCFLGLSEDVEIAVETFHFALEAMIKSAQKYCKQVPKEERARVKNDFLNGFLNGLESAFKKQVEENEWGLILVKDELVILASQELNLVHKKKTGIQPEFNNDRKAYNEGYKEGEKTGNIYKEDMIPDNQSEQ